MDMSDKTRLLSVRSRLHTYRFILDETIGAKQLIKTLYQLVKRFIQGSFRYNLSMAAIISKTMKRCLDKLEIPLYYNNIYVNIL